MLEGIGRFAHARHGFCVVSLLQGKHNNDSFFAFVAIEPHNYKYFRRTYERGLGTDFSAFGIELLRGDGLIPSEDVIDYVRNKYNIEFDVDRPFMERLIAQASISSPEYSANESPFPVKPAETQKSS
jgi:hypothetical protein